jgi:hypothetical protein
MTGKKQKCQDCVDHPNEKPDTDPTRKIHYCRKRGLIGDFKMNYELWLPKLRYHRQKVILCGKYFCIKERNEHYNDIPGSVIIHRDYADKMNVEFHGQAQSQGMSNRQSLGIEGIVARFWYNDPGTGEDKERYELFSMLSTDMVQDARSSFIYTLKVIENLQGSGYLKRHSGAVLFENSDGCACQYTSATAWRHLAMVACYAGIGCMLRGNCCQQNGYRTTAWEKYR